MPDTPELPVLARLSSAFRYDASRGVIIALDLAHYPHTTRFTEWASDQEVANALAAQPQLHVAVGAYGLVLAAQAWRDRPSDSRRAAIIQAGARLRDARPGDARLERLIAAGLERANSAIMAGDDATAVLSEFADQQLQRAHRAVERCGRNAAELLDEHEQILTCGYAGPELDWMLYVAHVEQGRQLHLYAAESPGGVWGAAAAAHIAAMFGLPATTPDDPAIERLFEQEAITIVIIGADRVGLDGSVIAPAGTRRCAQFARQYGVPCYILDGDGADPSLAYAQDAASRAGWAPVPAELINAIVTTRGIYRPERIGRATGGGAPPIDFIPLNG